MCGVGKHSAADKELKKCFKKVLPLCDACKTSGKESLKKGSLHTDAAK